MKEEAEADLDAFKPGIEQRQNSQLATQATGLADTRMALCWCVILVNET